MLTRICGDDDDDNDDDDDDDSSRHETTSNQPATCCPTAILRTISGSVKSVHFSKPGPRWNLRKPHKISGRVVDLWTEFCPTCLPNTLTKVPGSIKNLHLCKSSTQTSPKIKLTEMADWRGW